MQLGVYVRRQEENLAHPFHVKSTWQPPIQNSAALERYLEETKLVLASTVFHAPLDNISANERKAIGSLKRNSEINLKKTLSVIINKVYKSTDSTFAEFRSRTFTA